MLYLLYLHILHIIVLIIIMASEGIRGLGELEIKEGHSLLGYRDLKGIEVL